MEPVVRVKGVRIEFADGPLVVPPLSLASIEALQDRITTFSGGMGDVGTVIDALYHALKRNYPEMTREQCGEMVDMENMGDVMSAVMNVSGMKKRAEGLLGEAKTAS